MWTLNQFFPSFQPHDAIANQMVELHRMATGMGAQSRIWCSEPSRRVDVPVQPFARYRPQPGDVALLHYGSASAIDPFMQSLQAPLQALCVPVVLYYHNITPHPFLEAYNPPLARAVRLGRERLAQHYFGQQPYTLAGSPFNRDELRGMGYTGQINVLPYLVRTDLLKQAGQHDAAQRRAARWRDKQNWLFVGRLSPHKNQEAVIQAFAHYHQHIEPASRLILAGSARSAPGYQHHLRAWAVTLGVDADVVIGQPNDTDLAAYYSAADVFVCLSRHEGFCVPLLEAMAFDVPIVAWARAAVPDTLGDAGVLLHSAHPVLVAEAVRMVLTRPALRDSIVAAQQQQFQHYAPAMIEAQIADVLARLKTLAIAPK